MFILFLGLCIGYLLGVLNVIVCEWDALKHYDACDNGRFKDSELKKAIKKFRDDTKNGHNDLS